MLLRSGRALALLLAVCGALACSEDPGASGEDAATDAGSALDATPTVDAGPSADAELDAGFSADAANDVDAGADAGEADASEVDAGEVDSGAQDAAEADSGASDAADLDSGEPDAAEADSGEQDAGEADSAEPDAGETDSGEQDSGEQDAGEPDSGVADTGNPVDAGPPATAVPIPGTTTFYTGIVDMVAVGDQIVALSNPRINGTIHATLTRFNADGSVDTTFGVNGHSVLSPAAGRSEVAAELAVDSEGRFVVGGYFVSGASNTFLGAIRTDEDGIVDTSFGTNGFFAHSFGNQENLAHAVAIASDDDVLLGGVYGPPGSAGTKQWALVRIDEGGAIDGNFGTAGASLIDIRQAGSGYGGVGDLIGRADGTFLASGTFINFAANGGADLGLLARFTATGGFDGNFGTAGRVDLDSFEGSNQSSGVQSTGQIVVFATAVRILRYEANGTPDTTWGTAGIAQLSSAATSISVSPDDYVYATGQAYGTAQPTRLQLVRRNPNGTADTAFGIRTMGLTDVGLTGSVAPAAIAFTQDGRVWVGGWYTQTGGQQGLFLAAFQP